MDEDVMNNDMIKRLQKIEEKSIKKHLKNGMKDIFYDVIQNRCKDFRENVFFKEMAEIDEELDSFSPKRNYNKNENKDRKKIRYYIDNENEEEEEESEKNAKK